MNPANEQNPSLYSLTVSHYLLSAICFVVLAVMVLFSSEELTGHYFHPQLLAVTHMAALGWGTLIIFGACYQLLPVILETGLYSYKLGWVSLSSFLSGLMLLVYAFWIFDPGHLMQCGSLLLLTGILLFGLNIFFTAKNNNKETTHQEFILTACLWLIFTAILGTLLVFNFRYAFLPKDHLQFLKLHAHMGIGGWFLMLIIGVSSKLLPMFMVSARQKPLYLSWSYYLINIALLLFLADTYFYGINIKTYFIAFLAVAGISAWLIFIFHCFRSRMRNAIDMPLKFTFLSLILLCFAVFLLPLIVYHQLKANPEAVQYTLLYGTLLFMGWVSALILGQTFKTLPYIVWVKHYQHLAGKRIIPMPADLVNQLMLKIQFVAFLGFLIFFYIGLIVHSDLFRNLGLFSFLVTTLVYLANVLVVLNHKTKQNDRT